MNAIELDKESKKIVKTAMERMLRFPDTFDMGLWANHSTKPHKRGRKPEGYCGTTACAAGHVALAAGCPPMEHVPVNKLPDFVIRKLQDAGTLPATLLDGSGDVQTVSVAVIVDAIFRQGGGDLYYVENWDKADREAYEEAKRKRQPRKAAAIAVKRFRQFLRRGH